MTKLKFGHSETSFFGLKREFPKVRLWLFHVQHFPASVCFFIFELPSRQLLDVLGRAGEQILLLLPSPLNGSNVAKICKNSVLKYHNISCVARWVQDIHVLSARERAASEAWRMCGTARERAASVARRMCGHARQRAASLAWRVCGSARTWCNSWICNER